MDEPDAISFNSEEQTSLAGTIKAIDKRSVHRICSGQVVLTLATAVKELVENSIDAGATTVEVRLREYGSELIEVIDNGSGVEEKNFEGLTLKHHTSKLQDFSDLVGVDTFGFRGEALSSLCALSSVTIVTRHITADVGTKMEFDHNGRISNRVAQARQVGTSVTLQNVFSTLPVRHKEFQRNLKKEFAKMIQVLNSYCIISTGVRITCSNQTAKGHRSVVVSSKGNSNMKENISNVFGPKQMNSLLDVKQLSLTEEVSSEYGVQTNQQTPFRLEGFISKCAHGLGRSSADRQYFFINKRPCDSTKLSKVVNEVYHQYNRHQYPFVALHITMARDAVDVNVTPDKRQIFMQDEKLLLATVKSSLLGLYEPTTSLLQINTAQTHFCKGQDSTEKTISNKITERHNSRGMPDMSGGISALSKLKRSFSSAFSKDGGSPTKVYSRKEEQVAKQRKLDRFVTRPPSLQSLCDTDVKATEEYIKDSHKTVIDLSDENSSKADSPNCKESGCSSSQETWTFSSHSQNTSVSNLQSHWSEESQTSSSQNDDLQDSLTDCSPGQSSEEHTSLQTECINISSQSYSYAVESNSESLQNSQESCQSDDCRISSPRLSKVELCSDTNFDSLGSDVDSSTSFKFKNFTRLSVKPFKKDDGNCKTDLKEYQDNQNCFPCMQNTKESLSASSVLAKEDAHQSGDQCSEVTITQYDELEHREKHQKTVEFSLAKLRKKALERKNTEKSRCQEDFCRTFRATITPTDNQSAEEELQREITKDMFAQMLILGQFNLGFIIVRNNEDLFIVDQHATDEKYNFEQLQKHTVVQSQRLIQPQCLELTASSETILIDNLEIFKKNGFDFIIDEQGPPTQRVKLVSIPVSKNWTFGKEDIEELIFMLSDSPGIMCRPSRVRQMFASRSCRKSVMIGTALNHAEMKKLVTHMGEIEQPWNCPHGRPTMRHLINLQMVPR